MRVWKMVAKETFEEMGWSCSIHEQGNDTCFEVERYGDSGEDIVESFVASDLKELVQQVEDCYEGFDLNDYVKMWLEAKEHGMAGVPDAAGLVEAGKEYDGYLKDLTYKFDDVFKECEYGIPGEVFLVDGQMYCLLDGEEALRALRDNIRDIKEGDAFFCGDDGAIVIAGADSHQNLDEADEPWIVYDEDDTGWFEEEIGEAIGSKVRAVLGKLDVKEEAVRLDEVLARARDAAKIGNDCEGLSKSDKDNDEKTMG